MAYLYYKGNILNLFAVDFQAYIYETASKTFL